MRSLKHFLAHNWFLKLFSLALATMFWMTIASESSSEIGLSVPLEFRDLPPAFEIVEETTDSIEVRLRGSSNLIKQISAADIIAVIDLSGVTPGEKMFPVTVQNVRAPFGIDVVRVNPGRVRLTLERTLERQVPIVPSLRGKVAEGFELGSVRVTPSTVQVQGPESKIRSVESISTAPVAIDGLDQPVRQVVALDASEPLVRLQNLSSVEVRIDIREQHLERKFFVGKDATLNRWSVRPARVEITVKGPKQSIHGLRPETLHFTVEAENLAPGRHERTPKVIGLGDGIEIVSISPETVTVIVR